jgi:hypothetical protein
VFVVYVGYEPGSEELQEMAAETGGMFIKLHTPAELPETLAWLARYTQREFDEYRIVRSTRSVDNKQSFGVSMRLESCNDSVWVDRVFRFSMAATSTGGMPAPRQVELGQAYPSPLTMSGGRGTIEFTLSAALASKHVSLVLYDMLGREVRTLYEGMADIGSNSIRFDPSVLSPGVYMCTLRSDASAVSRKMVVLP